MMRNRVHARVGDAPGKNGNDRRHLGIQRLRHAFDLFQREHRGDVEFHAFAAPVPDQRQRRFVARVGDGNFDIDIFRPAVDFQRLPFHFGKLVGKHLERQRLDGDALQNVARERLEIRQPALRMSVGLVVSPG